jgi:CubicO group peptidase (beta-lactamase class C family)
MKQWCRALETHVLLNPAKQEQLFTRTVLSGGKVVDYGRGWTISDTTSGKRIHHGGALAGFRNKIAWYPELKLWVLVFSNRNDLDVSELALQILKLHQAAGSTQPNGPTTANQPNRSETNRPPSADGSLYRPTH